MVLQGQRRYIATAIFPADIFTMAPLLTALTISGLISSMLSAVMTDRSANSLFKMEPILKIRAAAAPDAPQPMMIVPAAASMAGRLGSKVCSFQSFITASNRRSYRYEDDARCEYEYFYPLFQRGASAIVKSAADAAQQEISRISGSKRPGSTVIFSFFVTHFRFPNLSVFRGNLPVTRLFVYFLYLNVLFARYIVNSFALNMHLRLFSC